MSDGFAAVIGAICAALFVGTVVIGALGQMQKADDFKRELACIESGGNWTGKRCNHD